MNEKDFLKQLGFVYQNVGSVQFILPPVCRITAGAFLQGSDRANDAAAWLLEVPQYTVTLPSYDIAMYPVTVSEYACAVNTGAVKVPPASEIKWEEQLLLSYHPVVNVSWDDAVLYAKWLTGCSKTVWRLPSEAEWEKASRGIDGRIFPWGNHYQLNRANTKERGIDQTTPINTFPEGASTYGVLDTIGNVMEWTNTLWKPYPYNPDDSCEDVDNLRDLRIARGGSYLDTWNNARSATRWPSKHNHTSCYKGFRLVKPIS